MENRELIRDYQSAISNVIDEHDGDVYLTIPTGAGLSTIVLDLMYNNSDLNILLVVPSAIIKSTYKGSPFYFESVNHDIITYNRIKKYGLSEYDIVILDVWYSASILDISEIKKLVVLNPMQIMLMNKRENTKVLQFKSTSDLTTLIRNLKINKLLDK